MFLLNNSSKKLKLSFLNSRFFFIVSYHLIANI